jgi:hypothetical protein
LTSKAKCTFTEYKKEANKSGGGPAPEMPTSSVEMIVNILQDTASFSGIEGGLETALWRGQFTPFNTPNEKQTTNK